MMNAQEKMPSPIHANRLQYQCRELNCFKIGKTMNDVTMIKERKGFFQRRKANSIAPYVIA